jgi:CRP-like cAMP-binding protein
MNIDKIIDQFGQLPEQSKSAFTANIAEVALPKGHILLKEGKVERSIYFIKKGIVRAYSDKASGQVTFWFGQEGDTVISMRSYVANEKGYENIELLEDCELYKLETRNLRALFDIDIHFANWGRKLAERELIKTEERLISMQFKTAMERYDELIKAQPDLLRRVQLGYIASYLGISQVSLSRIRAGFR